MGIRILLLAAVMALAACGQEAVAKRNCTSEIGAFVQSQAFVKQRLRSPSSAKFPTTSAPGVHARQAGVCKFTILAYVDAQNAFGGTVRTRYAMDLEYNPQRNVWTAENIIMD